MGRTLTNNFSMEVAIEDSIGVLPGSPTWKLLEPNTINTFGATITTVPRSPISKNRQRRKGTITDLDSAVEFDADLTMDVFVDFIEGFMFANFTGPISTTAASATTSAFTVTPAMAQAIAQNTLVVTRGFANAGNNGTHLVDTGGTTTTVPVTTAGLVAETPAATRNCTLEIAGFRFATGDLEVNADGNLITTTKDFTELGLEVGQAIHVGGLLAANRFAQAANYGYARIVSIATNLLVIDKKVTTFVTDAGAGQAVDLLFGRFVKNVPVDDSNYLERSFQFEGAYQDLDDPGNEYEYAIGNFCNTVGFELPLTDKAITSFAFIGTDTEEIVGAGSRKTNADSPLVPVQTTAFNTSSDIARLRITEVDETGLTTDFKSVTLNINNNVTPEKVLGTLGARFMNAGNFEIDLESQLLFSNSAVVTAIRNNETLTMDFTIVNDNEAIFVDIPSMTLGGGDKEYPVNESILINTTAQAFEDTTYNASLMISLFPQPPAKT